MLSRAAPLAKRARGWAVVGKGARRSVNIVFIGFYFTFSRENKMVRTPTATTGGRNKSSRRMTFIWIALAVALIIGLIWTEQVALLYVLATLSVTALLLVVAFADLGGARQQLTQPIPNDDSAAAGDGLTASRAAARASQRR